MNNILETLLNDLCLNERIENGTFDISNNEHIDMMREYLTTKGIAESDAIEFTNRVVEGGKYPDRQAYNKNGILVTFPTPQHKQNGIRRGTHFEKDPTKGKPNLFTDPEGNPKNPPGRPRKDKEAGGREVEPGAAQSVDPTGDASSLPVSGGPSTETPDAADTDSTTTAAPTPDGEEPATEPAQDKPQDVLPPKPPAEKEQDKKAIQHMMASKNVSLGAPLQTGDQLGSPEKAMNGDELHLAQLHINEALKALNRIIQK